MGFYKSSSAIYSGSDGSLSVDGTFSYNGGQHGANIGNGTVFSLEVPAGQTTLTFGVCSYGSSSATVSAGDQVLEERFSLSGAATDGQEASIQYTSETSTTITVDVIGNGYLHSITTETITPPQVAVVSGTVTSASGSSADGQTLVFTDESGGTLNTGIADGSYRVSLPVGHVYTVSFENSDIYEITEGAQIDLTDAADGDEVTGNLSYRVIWDTSKVIRFEINGTEYTITPGTSSSDDFTVAAEGGNGSVELSTAGTAIVWANLAGAGIGTLMPDTLQNVSNNVTYELSGNTITFTYTDTETSPTGYTVQVKDNSASGTPRANGQTTVYDFGDGSIISDLYVNNYSITGGNSVKSTDGIVTVTGNNRIRYNDRTHGIVVGEGDQISVKVAGNAEIGLELCGYSAAGSTITAEVDGNGSLDNNSVSARAGADGDRAVFTYTGDAATLTFTYHGSGSGYLHSIDVRNELPETEITEQPEMPTEQNLEASPVGQRLTLSQEGGSLSTNAPVSDSIGCYGFEFTDNAARLEADVVVNSCGNSSSNGVFFGAFNGTDIETIAIRNSTNLRGIYTNENSEVRAGRLNETIAEGQRVHFTVEKTEDGFRLTATPAGGETYTVESSSSDGLVSAGTDGLSFGFILANAEVTVTNMKYYDTDGTLLYDQNACYEAVGTAPVVNAVHAEISDTRDSIIVRWNSSELPDGDGCYVIQVRKDGGDWEDVTETTESSLTYPAAEAGTYEFRVGGKLGSEGEVTYCDETAVVEDYLPALPAPVVTVEAGEASIDVSWTVSEDATLYEVYRYSSDEGAENAKVVYTAQETETLSWTDTQVEQEVPYYYYVIAYQYGADSEFVNSSNPSQTVWTMASAGHAGDYVYEDEAAVITVTDCSDETVFQNRVTIKGTVDRAGTISASVNSTQADMQTITAANGTFAFELGVSQGRNEVELLFTDENGKVTRQTRNFVYLTNYDIIVDAYYTGEDGAEVDSIPTYSTVQAAVDSVPADNTERKVIFIKNGDYEERLVVESPYISLIGQSRDGVRIHCYPAENLTFANDYVYGSLDKSNQSADALRCDADGASFVNVTVSGVQDTLYMHAGNQYYYQCRIEGLIDFIYSGDSARALFEDCELVFVYEESHPSGGYICAPRTSEGAPYGLIFKDCAITSEEGCEDGTFYLARPWGPDGAVCWINCYMGSAVHAEAPYADMSGNLHTEAEFYEYGSYGPGYAVNADRRQLSPAQAETLLKNLGWDPASLLQETHNSYNGNIAEPEPEEPEPDTPSGNPDGGSTGSGTGTESDSTDKEAETVSQKEAVQTGDSTNVLVWMTVLVISGAVSMAVLAVRRKRG